MDLQFLAVVAHDVDCQPDCGHIDRIPDLWVELLSSRVLSIPEQRVAL